VDRPQAPAVRLSRDQPAGRALLALLLIAATLGVYSGVAGHEFTNFDDDVYIVRDPELALGWSPAGVGAAFSSTRGGNWVPVTRLSWLLEQELHGLAPGLTQLGNVALHAASAALLFLILAALTGATGASLFVAGVFALHPVHVESVAWAIERRDVLCGLFFVAGLGAWASYVRRPDTARYAAVIVLMMLALGAKPMAVSFPFALLLLDRWPLGRAGGWSGLVLEKLPLFALSAAASVATLLAQGAGGALRGVESFPIGARLANALVSYVLYLKVSLWPVGLAVFYPHAGADISWGAALLAALLLAGLTALCWGLRSRSPAVLIGWLFFLGTLLPVIGLVQVGMQSRADRYLYLPQIGLTLALAFGVRDLLVRDRRGAAVAGALAGAALILLAMLTITQLRIWQSSVTLFEHALRVAPEGNYLAHINLGQALMLEDRAGEAVPHLESARELVPELVQPHWLLGVARHRQGRPDEAIPHLERAIALDPEREEPKRALAVALNDVAWRLATDPDPAALDPGRAVRYAERAVSLTDGEVATMLDTLAVAYRVAGRPGQANGAARRALARARVDGDARLAEEIRARFPEL
jgi:hypothetical protein